MSKTIHLPLTCDSIAKILLVGVTILFIVSIYQSIMVELDSVEWILSEIGLIIGGLGTVVGWIIYFIENGSPLKFECRCNK